MLPQAKPFWSCSTRCTTNLATMHQPHNLNKISTTNNQQRSNWCASSQTINKLPKLFNNIPLHSLQSTLPPTAPIPNPNSRTYPNHRNGPTSNSKKKSTSYNCNLHKPTPRSTTLTYAQQQKFRISKKNNHNDYGFMDTNKINPTTQHTILLAPTKKTHRALPRHHSWLHTCKPIYNIARHPQNLENTKQNTTNQHRHNTHTTSTLI